MSIRIKECLIPTDFVVLKYGHEHKDPLILRRPFLATASEIIDEKKGHIYMDVVDLLINFDIEELFNKPIINGQIFFVDHLIELAKESFRKMCYTDPLERATASVSNVVHLDDQVTEFTHIDGH